MVYKNGVAPTITFSNSKDKGGGGDADATEVLRLEQWKTEDITEYLKVKLREDKTPELAEAAAKAKAGDADAAGDDNKGKMARDGARGKKT